MSSPTFDPQSFDPQMNSPAIGPSHRLGPILAKTLKDRGLPELPTTPPSGPFWSASHFKLDRVRVFNNAPESVQDSILRAASDMLMREAFFIEKGGMFYTSKLAVLAQTTDEKVLYSLFSAEEAAHFHWVSSFFESEKAGDFRQNPFVVLLSEIAQNQGKLVMTYILQVVLEGWGLHHYHELAEDCLDPRLQHVFQLILRDEAKHHGAGLVLCDKDSPDHIPQILGLLRQFLMMIQCGPQGVMGILNAYLGPLSHADCIDALTSLNCVAETQRKLNLIRDCIQSAQMSERVLAGLTESNSLRAYPIELCAEICLGQTSKTQ